MTQVIARTKVNGKHFEILVDADVALAMKKSGRGDVSSILAVDAVFTDSKKGFHASANDLEISFKTSDINEIAKQIIMKGEIQIPQEYREKMRGEKFKQVVDFLVRNSTNSQSGNPYTPERIERALDEIGVNITNKPIELQMKEIVSNLSKVIPLKIKSKRLKVTIPAQYTGQAYSLLNPYKESEEWLGNGDLKAILNVPVGFQMEFYDKLNAITHGSGISEEMKEDE
ncbi:ribosome assembly factor SBDS [Candidatus Pacearchaeota archaeon CG10_big_fil_rev_8_21_14_0_10_30_48]|nr:MAG: ribosome assembly factor SBDS [Candidatus Pacearchaeota archaeon CG10_big_fil_rev_8_21_14_0_10_30_48]